MSAGFWRAMRWLLPIGALCWALIGWGIHAAVAAPPDPVQAEADRIAAWLADELRADVPSRPVTVTDRMHYRTSRAEAHPDGTIRIRTIESLRWHSRVELLTEELLHRPDLARCFWHRRAEEEGITHALARDLMPALSWQLYGRRWRHGPQPYPQFMAAIRANVAAGAGARSWRTRAARTRLRVMWGASCEGRLEMIREGHRLEGVR